MHVHRHRRGRRLWLLVIGAAGLLLLSSAGCGDGDATHPPTAASEMPSPSPSAPALADAWQPRIVLTPGEIDVIRARLEQGDEPWASAWRHFRDDYVARALSDPAPVEPGPYRGRGEIHDAFRALDTASRRARDLAIAYAITGREDYGRRARDILVEWAAEAEPTRPRHYRSLDTGQLQSWGAFSFAYAYDLTRGGGLYSRADERLIDDYFARFIVALSEALEELAHDPSVGTGWRRPYEWSETLTYRFEDRVIGGTFSLALQNALVALAIETGDDATLHAVLADPANPLRADRAIRHALRPDNDGDGRVAGPAPQVAILKTYRPERGGTVDYMTYNARLATLLCEATESVAPELGRSSRAMLRTSWLYLARFFGDDARPSPNPYDHVDLRACLPRFVPAAQAVRDPRLTKVVRWGDEARYYEPQFLGPVTLTHMPTE